MADNKKGGCLSLVVGGLVLCAIIGGCQNLFGMKDDSDYISAAHDYVETQLKSPGTASWCDNDKVSKNDEDNYVVVGCVDAENSFGATVRIVYGVTEDKDTNVVDHVIMQK